MTTLGAYGGGLVIGGGAKVVIRRSRAASSARACADRSSHRLLLAHQPLVREFDRGMIARNFPLNGTTKLAGSRVSGAAGGGFKDWRLPVEGLVSRPGDVSLPT